MKYEIGSEFQISGLVKITGATQSNSGHVNYSLNKGFSVPESTLESLICQGAKAPEPSNYHSGDKVKVIGNTCGHLANTGDVITLLDDNDLPYDSVPCWHYAEHGGYISQRDFEPYTEPAPFDWDAFKSGEIAVHCDTEEKAKAFLAECDKKGMTWCSGEKTSKTYWHSYGSRTCYADGVSRAPIEWLMSHGYEIIDYPFAQPEIIVTRDMLVKLRACDGGKEAFDEAFPSGKGTWNDVLVAAEKADKRYLGIEAVKWLRDNRENIEKMQNEPVQEPVKLYCIKNETSSLRKGTIYEFSCGYINVQDGPLKDYYYGTVEHMFEVHPQLKPVLIPLVKRPAKVGEWIYIAEGAIGTSKAFIGKIVKVTSVENGDLAYFCSSESTKYQAPVLLEYYFVLDGYKPEPEQPKYYNGKVFCSDVRGGSYHTTGHIYKVIDGILFCDDGKLYNTSKPYESFSALCASATSEFKEVLE